MKYFYYIFFLFFFLNTSPAFPKISEKNSDILFEIEKIKQELEIIRHYLGKPLDDQVNAYAENANSREVYFQAMTMYQKTERLVFERTAKHVALPEVPNREITDQDVLEVTHLTLNQLNKIKAYLKIEKEIENPTWKSNIKSSTIFKEIININRKLNLLLNYSFSPSDVFQQVELANNYTLSLINFYDQNYQSKEINFIPNKFPKDVLKKLIDSFEIIKKIYQQSALDSIEFQIDQNLLSLATPSDVYDIASLIVAELTHLHRKVSKVNPPQPVYYPGQKIPADVFKLASELHENLLYLNQLVKKNSDWLNQK